MKNRENESRQPKVLHPNFWPVEVGHLAALYDDPLFVTLPSLMPVSGFTTGGRKEQMPARAWVEWIAG